MQELEKILEEIDRQKSECLSGEYEPAYAAGALDMANAIKDIIRKHMNDGWISVEESLPENGKTVLCTDGENIYLVEYDADLDAPFGDMEKITDWQPSPEPYRPERSVRE